MEAVYKLPISECDLRDLYHGKKLSLEAIARLYGTDSGTVSYYRKKYKIEKLECWQRYNVPTLLSNEEENVVLGHLLGDGHLGRTCKYPHLRVSQCLDQISFVQQIYDYIDVWASYKPVIDSHLDKRTKRIYETCRFDTISHPVFSSLFDLCYPNGKKSLSINWLNKIGPLGLAIWYEGDGYLSCETLPVLKTNSFSKDEHQLIVNWLKNKFNITSYYANTSSGYNVRIEDSMMFREQIEPYIIDYFKYKLPRGKFRKKRNMIWKNRFYSS